MRYMMLVKAPEAGPPSPELMAAVGQLSQEMAQAGVSGKERTVIDGPFTETKELVAGFWLLQARSKEEVIEWVKRCPNPSDGESEIEIRQVFEADDFGDALSPELRAQEEQWRQAHGYAER